MSSGNRQPFIDSRAFDKVNSTYVTFPSQADAMLASLQLFHDVPCRIMNLVFSVITHPDFDSKQVTLLGSADVIDVAEENRLKDRMAVVQERSASEEGHGEQAGFPQFILDEVLDIIHAERMDSVKTRFDDPLYADSMYCKSMDIEEDNTLKAMTVIHRSWTTLAQKALGRVLHIGRPTHEMNILLSPVRKSIFGPWTSVVAIKLYHPTTKTTNEDEYTSYQYTTDVHATDEYRKRFENLHRILVGFTNVKYLYIKSYASLFTKWSNLTFEEMVRRNERLEEVTLHADPDSDAFHFDPLIKNAAVLKNLRNLNIRGAWISDVTVQKAMQGPGFECLNNVTIKCFFDSLENDLRVLSVISSQSNSHLESLRIIDSYERRENFEDDIARAYAPSQCAAIFEQLRTLHIDSTEAADQWFNWIVPYCSSLETLSIVDRSRRRQSFEENVARTFTPSQSAAVFEQLRSLHIDSKEAADLWLKWFGSSCSGLRSLRLATNVSVTPDTLNFIPITIHNLDLVLWTKWGTTVTQISAWKKCLLKIASSMHFPKLKSFTLLTKGYLEVGSLCNEMQKFKEEINTTYEELGSSVM